MFDQSGRVGVEAVRTVRVRVGLRLVVMVRVRVRLVQSARVTMVWPVRGCLAVMVLTEMRVTVAAGIAVLVALWVVTVVAGAVVGMVSSHGLYLMDSLMGTCRWCVLSRACWMALLVRPRCSFTAPLQSIGVPLTPAGPLAL